MTLATAPIVTRPTVTAPSAPASPRATGKTELAPAPSPGLRVRRFTVAEYQRLIRDGYFAADERCELLEGLIVQTMPRHPLQDAVIARSRRIVGDRTPAGWHMRGQSAVVTDDSQPEPGQAVVIGDEFVYADRHPTPAETALIIEVSNSTLADDRRWKGILYARAGFAVYWIINLVDRRVEVYTDPTGPDAAPAYRRREDFAIGQSIPFVVDGVDRGPIAVADLLP